MNSNLSSFKKPEPGETHRTGVKLVHPSVADMYDAEIVYSTDKWAALFGSFDIRGGGHIEVHPCDRSNAERIGKDACVAVEAENAEFSAWKASHPDVYTIEPLARTTLSPVILNSKTKQEAIDEADRIVQNWRRSGYRGGAQLLITVTLPHSKPRTSLVEVYGKE